MGNHCSITRLRKRCSYSNVNYNICGLASGTLTNSSPNTDRNSGFRDHTITLEVLDEKRRRIKYISFFSSCDDQWTITDYGVQLSWKGGQSNSRSGGEGTKHYWSIDNQKTYEESDRREEQQRQQEAKEAQDRAAREKAERENAEKEAKEKTEREKSEGEARETAEPEAREKAERERAEKAASERQAEQNAMHLKNEKSERDSAGQEIAHKISQIRKQQEMNSQISTGWRTEESKALQKEALDSVPLFPEREDEQMKLLLERLKLDLQSKEEKKRNDTLILGFQMVKSGFNLTEELLQIVKNFILNQFNEDDESLMTILKNHLHYMPKSVIDVIFKKILSASSDETSKLKNHFGILTLIFKRKSFQDSPWQKETIDEDLQMKLIDCIKKYSLLFVEDRKVVLEKVSLDDIFNSTKEIYIEKKCFPKGCIEDALGLLIAACELSKSLPNGIYEFLPQIINDDGVLIPLNILDLIVEHISDKDKKQEDLLRLALNKGFLTTELLEYLCNIFCQKRQSTFTQLELLTWIGEFVQDDGPIKIDFFPPAMKLLIEGTFSSDTEFNYLLSILEFCFLNFDNERLKEDSSISGTPYFLALLQNPKSTKEMKTGLLVLMSKILGNDFIVLDEALLKFLYGTLQDESNTNKNLIGASSTFLQIVAEIDVGSLSWLVNPDQVIDPANLPKTKFLTVWLKQNLQQINHTSPTILESVANALKTELYTEVDMVVSLLTILGLQLELHDTHEILRPYISYPCDWLIKYLSHISEIIREKSVFVFSQIVLYDALDLSQEYFQYLLPVVRNWPTEKAHGYASKALVKLINNLDKEKAKEILEDFLDYIKPSACSSSSELTEGASNLLEAWSLHQEKFDDKDFETLQRFSSGTYGPTMIQCIFGNALGRGIQPIEKMIKELKEISTNSKHNLPQKAIVGFQSFVEHCEDEEHKISLAEILEDQYAIHTANPDSRILDVLEKAAALNNAKLVLVYVTAARKFASYSKLPETTIKKMWDIVDDIRNELSVRKLAAGALMMATKCEPEILRDEFLENVIKLLDNVNLRAYALFILCYPLKEFTFSNPSQQEILSRKLTGIAEIESASVSIEPDEKLAIRLASHILQNMAKWFPDFILKTEISSRTPCNWLLEWINIHPEDCQAFITTENKRANKLLKLYPEDKHGYRLKLQVMMIKATKAIGDKEKSKGISWAEKSRKYAEANSLPEFDRDLFLLLSSCNAHNGNHRAAIKFLKKIVVLKSTTANDQISINYSIAKSLLANGNYKSGLNVFQRLPSINEVGYSMEIKLCKHVETLYLMLVSSTYPKSIAQAQVKYLLTKSLDMERKTLISLVENITKRGKYYDLSVLATQKQEDWELEFLKREVFGRAAENTCEFQEFEKSFVKLKMFFKMINSNHWIENMQLTFEEIVRIQISGHLLSIPACIKCMFFLRVPLEDSSKIFENTKSECVMDQLEMDWLRYQCSKSGKINPVGMKKLQEFWNFYKECSMQELGLDFLENFLEISLPSNTLKDILSFLQFCQEHSIKPDMIKSSVDLIYLTKSASELNLKEWESSFQREKISDEMDKVWTESGENTQIIKTNLIGLYDRGKCTLADITKLMDSFQNSDDEQKKTEDLVDILTTYNSYGLEDLKTGWGDINTIWDSPKSDEWKTKIRAVALATVTSSVSTQTKTISELLLEFKKINPNNPDIFEHFDKLPSLMNQITEKGEQTSELGISEKPINSWDHQDLLKWSLLIRNESKISEDPYLPELLAIFQRAIFLFKGYGLRDVGIMSICIFMLNKGKGCLSKIATGEGKSAIVATIAAIKNLQGRTVDIITSSPILANRDADEWELFYSSMSISVMDNAGLQEVPDKPKVCYTKDVVYGDASTFEGDVLRHEFSLLGTRGERQFDVVIVDEVDSMFIDGSNHSTRLIDKMPQMDYLEGISAAVWYSIGVLASGIIKLGDHTLIINKPEGAQQELLKAVFNTLPNHLKEEFKCGDSMGFKLLIENFSRSMKGMEIGDERYRGQVMGILQNRKLHSKLAPEIQEILAGLKSPSEITKTHSIIDEYINLKWKMSDSRNEKYILEIFLDAEIMVLDVDDNKDLVLSPMYHSEGFEDYDSDDKKMKMFFFLAENEIYSMNIIPNERQYIAKKCEEDVRSLVKSSKLANKDEETPCVHIPSHLYELFNCKIDEWIQSALQAKFTLELNRDYVIKESSDGEFQTITPIDFRNTGVTQESCVWGEGLHQFLQIKHKLRISPEYLATNFISNLSFFRRYGQNIFGLTGTLGDESELSLLKELYSLSTFSVPTFKPKRLLELRPVVAQDRKEWLTSILNSTAWEINSGRSVLIICNTIQDVENVHSNLKSQLAPKTNIEISYRLYSRSDETGGGANISAELNPGTVVIATNLAGRGTNIKLSKTVVENGGLHVIISFLPSNLRVEEQAAGRAARSGEPGTSQLILNTETDISVYEDESSLKMENIKKTRESDETRRVDHIKNKLAHELYIEEKQFRKYCELRSFVKEKNGCKPEEPDHILNGIGERWAIELEETKTRCDILNWDLVDKKFDSFFSNLRNEFCDGRALRNPSYYILKGNDLILKGKFSEGKDNFTKAIDLDKVFVQHAHYNRAYAIINKGGDKYKENAIKELTAAGEIIQTFSIPALTGMHSMLQPNAKLNTTKEKYEDGEIPVLKASDADSEITKQLINKINFHYLQLRSINEASKKIQETKGDVVAKFSDTMQYYKDTDQEVNYGDISEMHDNGFVAFMYIEAKPVPWWNIFAVMVLGLIQVILGTFLCLVGAVNFGAGLIGEGIGDIITGITAAVTGEFSWGEYLKGKALSVGISLLCMGAGVALKAVAKIAQVATLIAKVGTGIKWVAGGIKSFAMKGLAKIGTFVKWAATGVKNIAMKGITKVQNFFSGAASSFKSSSIGNYITTSKVWITSAKILKSAKDKAIEFAKKIRDGVMFIRNKLFGSSNYSLQATSNRKLAGQLIVRKALNVGLMQALDYGLLAPVGDEIERQIKATTIEFLTRELAPGTELGDKFLNVLKSCKGQMFDKEIGAHMDKVLQDQSSFGLDFVKSFVKKAAKQILGEITKLDNIKPKSGRAALLLFFAKQVVDIISQSVDISETIAKLTTMLPVLIKELDTVLNEMKAVIESHDHNDINDCNGKSKPVNDNDIEKIRGNYIEKWSETIAAKMKELIINNVIKPQVQFTVTGAFEKLSKAEEFNDFLEQKATSNRRNIMVKRPKTSKPSVSFKKDNNDPGEVVRPQNQEKPSTLINPEPMMNASAENPQVTLNIMSERLNSAIDLYRENNGEMKLKESYGNHGNNADPIRILQTEDGKSFSPIISSQSGELKVMEFKVHPEAQSSSNLVAAVFAANGATDFTAKDIKTLERSISDYTIKTRPKFVTSPSGSVLSNKLTRDTVYCRNVNQL